MISLTRYLYSIFNTRRVLSFALAIPLILNPITLHAANQESTSSGNQESNSSSKSKPISQEDLEFYALTNSEIIEKVEEYLKELNELDELIKKGEITQEEAALIREALLKKVNDGTRIAGGYGILAVVGLVAAAAGGGGGDDDSSSGSTEQI